MNNLQLSGKIIKDIKTSIGANGGVYLNFTLGVHKSMGQGYNYINCVAFGKTAQNIEKFCKKGSKLLIDGELTSNTYIKKDGTKVFEMKVIAHKVEFISTPRSYNDGEQTTFNPEDEIVETYEEEQENELSDIGLDDSIAFEI